MKPLNTEVKTSLHKLAAELVQRWRNQNCYRVEQVTEAAEAVGSAADFIVYGHAIFCSKADFEAHYGTQPGEYDYEGLRKGIGKRFWPDVPQLDLATLLMLMMG